MNLESEVLHSYPKNKWK